MKFTLISNPSQDEAVLSGAPAHNLAAHADADRRTLPASVADRLRDLIIEGQLAAGSRLNERALCDRLGVSRTPLREAFRLLAAEGLVDIQPNRGAQVVALSEQDIRESFEVMSGLEALSGELACSRISDEEVVELRALTFEMLACHARKDLPAYYRINRAIHDRINQSAGNRLLSQTYATLNLRIQNLRFRSNFDQGKWDLAAREHVAMVDALAARDGARLAAIMRAHLQEKCESVLEALRLTQASAAASPLASTDPAKATVTNNVTAVRAASATPAATVANVAPAATAATAATTAAAATAANAPTAPTTATTAHAADEATAATAATAAVAASGASGAIAHTD